MQSMRYERGPTGCQVSVESRPRLDWEKIWWCLVRTKKSLGFSQGFFDIS